LARAFNNSTLTYNKEVSFETAIFHFLLAVPWQGMLWTVNVFVWMLVVLLAMSVATGDALFRWRFRSAVLHRHRGFSLSMGVPTGRVVHYRTGEPIANAVVILGDEEHHVLGERRTNAHGAFQFFMGPGKYYFTVAAPGFTMASRPRLRALGIHSTFYNGGVVTVTRGVPPGCFVFALQPEVADHARSSWFSWGRTIWQLNQHLLWPLWWWGLIVSSLFLWWSASPQTVFLVSSYLGIAVPVLAVGVPNKPTWGRVRKAKGRGGVDLALVRFFDVHSGRLVATYVTNIEGYFCFTLHTGTYRVEVSREGYETRVQEHLYIPEPGDVGVGLSIRLKKQVS
jgi:hypothetical protein